MKRKESISIPPVGATSLLTAFGVLCLVVFALLSLTTVQAEKRLAEASTQAVTDYYAADFRAEELFARLRQGELPEEVEKNENFYSYCCSVSQHQFLCVKLERTEDGWQVLRWQAVTREDAGMKEILPVWSGQNKEGIP